MQIIKRSIGKPVLRGARKDVRISEKEKEVFGLTNM